MLTRSFAIWILVGTLATPVVSAGGAVPVAPEAAPDRDEIGEDCIPDGQECGEGPCCSGVCDPTQDVPICAPTEPIPDSIADQDEAEQCLPLEANCPVDSDTDPCCIGSFCDGGLETPSCQPLEDLAQD